MSHSTRRDTAPREGTARLVPRLSPEALQQLIRHRGLDACAELVTSATPAQLAAVLDLDLWRPASPGRDEHLDVDRFGEWLEVLVDTGSSVAARTVAALDQNLVVAGLSRYLRVLDPGIFEPTAQSDDEPADRQEAMREGDSAHDTSGGRLECEVAGYIVRARRADAWDAILTLLLTLDAEHGNYFHVVMEGCRRLSHSRPETDGLDELLLAPEQHLHNVTEERERRRSQQGYVGPAEARAFLQMARQPRHTRSAATPGVNPIVAASFRAADQALEPASERLRVDAIDVAESNEAVVDLLAEAGVSLERPRPLLEAAGADPRAGRLTCLRRLMQYAHDADPTAHSTRSRELAFLANALLAGCSVQSRPFTPHEASGAALSICNLGFEYWPARWPSGMTPEPGGPFPPECFLIEHDLILAFEVGWSVLHQDVSSFVARQLISTLDECQCVDLDIQRGLVVLRRELVRQRDAGTLWLARGAMDVLGMLDMTAWISVLGLSDECPVLPAALTAILGGRTTTVSATDFDFISTAAQIGDVRAFMRRLPDLLSG